ncbi:MAG: hypothetical protein JOZ29_19595 [Deltaproteobacteria bacterium]|nr:hypothetical protein [Deltaproteobacteria bacterium]
MNPIEPFWQEAVVSAIEGVVAVGFLGFAAEVVTRRAQRRREENQVKLELVNQMTEAANALYLATQRHWRAVRHNPAANEPTASSRVAVEEQYQKTRTVGFVIEKRLEILFENQEARKNWHAAMDLLTITHYQVIGKEGRANLLLLKQNAGGQHSMLTYEILKEINLDPPRRRKRLLDAYRERLDNALNAVLTARLRPIHKIPRGTVVAEHPDPELYPET